MNISYQMNLTLKDNTVLKAYETKFSADNSKLQIQFLQADYSKAELSDIFAVANKANFKDIVKTTKDALYVATFSNYVGAPSVFEGTLAVDVPVTETVASTKEIVNDDGTTSTVPTDVVVTNNTTETVDIVTVELTFVDPTEQKLEELEKIVAPTIDADTCTLDELKEWQKEMINKECSALIYAGTDVTLSDGNAYGFTYKYDDQINYTEMIQEIIVDGYTMLPYHPNSGDCTVYSADDIKAIVRELRKNKTLLLTKCNGYHRMIDLCETKDDVKAIVWGSELSEKYAAIYDAILASLEA